jgi:CheY-like chemotaxis protein
MNMNVLVVEDNPISAKVMQHTLDKHGYEILTARDGQEALEYLESHAEIDLVITDLMMPKTDGTELIRTIRERPEWSNIPVLVCTSKRPESVNNEIQIPGGRFLFKPIRTDRLIQQVKEAFAQQRPVMQDPDHTRSQIGMESQAFCEILDESLKVVRDKITLLEHHLKEASVDPLDLRDLSEGAALLRAERIMEILNRLDKSPVEKTPGMLRSTYAMLLRELKALEHCLMVFSSR